MPGSSLRTRAPGTFGVPVPPKPHAPQPQTCVLPPGGPVTVALLPRLPQAASPRHIPWHKWWGWASWAVEPPQEVENRTLPPSPRAKTFQQLYSLVPPLFLPPVSPAPSEPHTISQSANSLGALCP